MQDYTIQRCTKRCRKSNRILRPGEAYYAVVELKNLNTIRYDIASCEWTTPPENAIAWWRAQMPLKRVGQRKPTPNAVLQQQLSEFCDDPQQQNLAYLLAMLLVRRKVLEYAPENSPESEEQLGELRESGILLRDVNDGQEIRVFEPSDEMTHEALVHLQAALQELLTMDTEDVYQGESAFPDAIDDTTLEHSDVVQRDALVSENSEASIDASIDSDASNHRAA